MVERTETSTRQQIVQLLHSHGGMTAKDIARELGITSMGVRRHLTTLERDGLTQAQMVRQKMGRPAFVYALSEQGLDLFPKNYHTLATQLLAAVQAREGESGVSLLFAARMEQLLGQYMPRMQGKTLAERVKELAKIQDEAGYMAVWTPTEGGFILQEQNCAIYRVACQFQQACQFEIELFRQLLDADITRLEHQVKGERYCTYMVRPKPSSLNGRVKKRR